MAKLSKKEATQHRQALDLLEQSRELTVDEQQFVYDNWQESANHVNSTAGAFFTPTDYALDFALEVTGPRVLDLCAGTGVLSWAILQRNRYGRIGDQLELVCVETNPAYIELGRRLLPEAKWVEADVFHLPDLGEFDTVIANPPFGGTKRSGNGPRYTGRKFEYHVIDVAYDHAEQGVFIVPQMSAPFRYSQRTGCYEQNRDPECVRFERQTGITLRDNFGIDTTVYREWHGVQVSTEVVTFDKGEDALENEDEAAA